MPQLRDAVIVAARRSPVGRGLKGALRNTRPDDIAISVVAELLAGVPAVPKELVADVAFGCAMPEAEQGLNIARVIALGAGLPVSSAAVTINRFCASGLQAIASISERIMVGAIECGIAGGVESMSMVPMGGNKAMLNPRLVASHPEIYISMGLTAENVARRFEVSREDQDAFALASHQKALAAQAAGKFDDELVTITTAEGTRFSSDEGPRADTSREALAALKPAFHATGTVTPGNSSPLNDGAAAVLLMSGDRAKALGLEPIARFVTFATAGVAPEIMGIGPVEAVPRALNQAQLKLADVDVVELNEAFASQSLAVIRKLGLDPERVNVNGGAIALGHPLGATGAKLTATVVHELRRRNARYGLVTMCVGGGMGAAGIVERL